MGYLDELFDEYYAEVGEGLEYRSAFKSGQIYWTPFFYYDKDLEFWRPSDLDDSKTIATSFKKCNSPQDLFNRKTPLSEPRLRIDEEFIVVRAKKRPAILIAPPPPEIPIANIRRGGWVNLNLCLLAPLFSIENVDSKAKYNEEFIDRIRKLEYRHLFFLPSNPDYRIKNSICRLDRLFSAYSIHLQSENLCIVDEVRDIFFSQLSCYINQKDEGQYKVAYELLQS